MHKVSLIIATLGERPDDLSCLLLSLVAQRAYISEVIIVDQHPDRNRLAGLLAKFQEHLLIRHTRSEPGLSRARNQGLSLVSGSLVAFPDDDCLYPEGLLGWVVDWFASNEEYDVLAVGAKDAAGQRSGNRWVQETCDIRPLNAFRTTFSPSLFLRSVIAKAEQFDVLLGVGAGTRFGSGEETDYVLRLIRLGARARFVRTRNIIHPRRDMLSGGASSLRAESYGFGMGHLLRLHALSVLWAVFLVYDVVRAGWSLCKGHRGGVGLCMAHARGLWEGYRAPVSEVAL